VTLGWLPVSPPRAQISALNIELIPRNTLSRGDLLAPPASACIRKLLIPGALGDSDSSNEDGWHDKCKLHVLYTVHKLSNLKKGE